MSYFDPKEFASKDGQPSPWPTVVDPELIVLCDRIRRLYGKPIVVNSGYRSPEHNAKVGGVADSLHVKGRAADITTLLKDRDDLPRLQEICLKLNSTGGVGLYDTFVHVDIRGYAARWDVRNGKNS